MRKAITIGAALLGLLFLGAMASSQDPEGMTRREAPPGYRDVLRGRVGQKIYATQINESGVWTLTLGAPAPAQGEADVRYSITGIGEDFVQIRDPNRWERFIPLSRVDVMVEPGK